MDEQYVKGRGAQVNTKNPYLSHEYVTDHVEGLDEPMQNLRPETEVFYENPKNIISKNDSPDLGFVNSINPYQGCEHGCIYCYARNAHQYWGFSAGLEFESKIIVKPEAPALLEKKLLSGYWKPAVIMLSGNTDCYQPLEKEHQLTRKILKLLLKYRNPVGLITKNYLVTRDLDILSEMAKLNLVTVHLSITTFSDRLRSIMEPRTSTTMKRMEAIRALSEARVPVGVMVAPIIPGLNNHEITHIVKVAAENGALSAGYNVVRLNGAVSTLFRDWLFKNFPDRAKKVWNLVTTLHGGQVNDTEWGRRLRGDGNLAESIRQMMEISRKRFMAGRKLPELDLTKFRRGGSYNLFE